MEDHSGAAAHGCRAASTADPRPSRDDSRRIDDRSNRALRRTVSVIGLGAALIAGALTQQATAAQGTFQQVLCNDPVTGRGTGLAGMPAELVSTGTNSRWTLSPSMSICPSGSATVNDGILISASGGSYPVYSYSSLTYRVPSSLELRAATIFRSLVNTAPSLGFMAFNQNAGTNPTDVYAEPRNLAESGDWFAGNATTRGTTAAPFSGLNRVDMLVHPRNGWTITAACRANGTTCDFADLAWKYRIYGGRLTLYDANDPIVSAPTGTLANAEPLRGVASVEFRASDEGAGVYRSIVQVDGSEISAAVLDANGGSCRTLDPSDPYVFARAQPCKASVGSGRVELDTTRLSEGTHTIKVLVEDAAGNRSVVLSRTAEIDNIPLPRNTVAPRWLSAPAVLHPGDTLEVSPGTWTPADASVRVRFISCEPAGDCRERAIGAATRYTIGDNDIGSTIRAEVLATNTEGTTTAAAPRTATITAKTLPDNQRRDAEGRDGSQPDPPPTPHPDAPGRGGESRPKPSWPISGLRNPVAGPGHQPNGSAASENAHTAVSFEIRKGKRRKSATTVTGRQGERRVIRGRVLNSEGVPIAGAKLVTVWQRASTTTWEARTGVVTTADGRFTYILPKGTSRKVRFIYFAFSDSTSYSASNTLTANVTAPVSLTITPRHASNGTSIRFSGRVATDGLPPNGALVTLRARYGKASWKQFKVVRSDRAGRFRATYRFTSTSVATKYSFQAQVARQGAYPFATGTSPTLAVNVTP